MSNSLSARVQLQGNLHAARGDLLEGMKLDEEQAAFVVACKEQGVVIVFCDAADPHLHARHQYEKQGGHHR